MAKKYEFQPDKPHSNWQSKLQLTPLQRKAILKWCLYGLVLLVLSLIQDVILCRFRFWGVTTELFPCAIFLITLLEGSQRGSIFALVASALYLFTGASPGSYAMVAITVIAILVTIFRQAYLQKNFVAVFLCVAVCMAIYEMVVYGFSLFLSLVRPMQVLDFLIIAGLSLIAVPLLYPIFQAISRIGGEQWKE